MPQDQRAKLECSECKKVGYNTTRNKKKIKERLQLSKFCKWCKVHTKHKETK